MPSTVEHLHPVVDVERAGNIIRQLHDQVCGAGQRVHITRADCDDTCVMISRTELASLERAISIFADTREFSEMCQMLSRILETAGEVYAQTAADEVV